MENLQIRLTRQLVERIDQFREGLPFQPNRTQAIRWLLETRLDMLDQHPEQTVKRVAI